MKLFTRMNPASLPLANTARRAVFRERACPEPPKARHLPIHPLPQPTFDINPQSPRPFVRRTAVRFASRPPQTCLKRRGTSTRARKQLILNRKIKAHTASRPRP